MGVRYFCDHCGNTVHEFTKLSYGDFHSALHDAYSITHHTITLHQHAVPQSKPKPRVPIADVELCDHCIPIWLERVANLCKQSDV